MNNKVTIRSKLTKKQIFTIPNILSFVRIALIPLIVWLYCDKHYYGWTLIVVTLSSITDIVDGYIARKFNMITDFGKFIDPVADKMTQVAMLICLVTRFSLMWLPLGLMFFKEVLAFVLRLIVFRKTSEVHSAEWHGKLNTVILYLMMSVHIVWYKIPNTVSTVLILFASGLMITSSVLYTISSSLMLKNSSEKEDDL